MRYITKDVDYTGCDSVIAEILKSGKLIRCKCYDRLGYGGVDRWVIGYDTHENRYITEGSRFAFADPIEKKRKAKTFVEIAQWLQDHNYVCNGKGEWEWISNEHERMPTYPMYLFCYCGREVPDGVFFPEEWLA